MGSTKQNVSDIISAASVACAELELNSAGESARNDVPVVSIQTRMIEQIAHEHGVMLSNSAIVELRNSLSVGIKDRQVHSSRHAMLGWLPGIQNIASDSEFAAQTEALGWAASSHFEQSQRE
jgi:uncharacterized protein (DUF697 family)